MTTPVRLKFEKIAKKILRKSSFWDDEMLFELDDEGAKDVDCYDYCADRPCFTLQLIVNKPINGVYVHHTISVDIVRCMDVPGRWPDDALHTVSERLKSDGCKLVFDQPQKVSPVDSSFHPVRAHIVRARREQRHLTQLFRQSLSRRSWSPSS